VLRRLGRILKWIVPLPVLLVALFLAVANTELVAVRFNPFDSADAALTVELALYQLVFLVFAVGALVGGFVVWLNQHKYRRDARRNSEAAAVWQARAQRAEQHDPRGGPRAIATGPQG
jgi:uncharacterized integral membrane protein